MDTNQPVKALELDKIVESGGEIELLEMMKNKSETVQFLNRPQLIQFCTTLSTVRENLEKLNKEDVNSQLAEMMRLTMKSLGRSNIGWTDLDEAEVVGMRDLLEVFDIPPFLVNLTNQFLTEAEKGTRDKGLGLQRDENDNELNATLLLDVEKQVDEIFEQNGMSQPEPVNNPSESIKRKLKIIGKSIELVKVVSVLETKVNDLKEISGKEKTEVESAVDIKVLLSSCRTMAQLTTKFPEFDYNERKEKIVCNVCQSEFVYKNEEEHDFSKAVMSRAFRNIKIRLREHLEVAVTHKKAALNVANSEILAEKTLLRSRAIGMRLGELSYYLLKHGRPSEDFTGLVSMLVKFGVDMGDLNHSFNYVGKFGKEVSRVVQGRLKRHLANRLPQTGCLPPCKILADKATHKHWTRQLIGIATIVPGAPSLIQSWVVGMPKCPKGDGEYLKGNIVGVVDKYLSPEQYCGTSMDGAYINCQVGPKLDEHFGRKGYHDWDPVHAAATIDTAMRGEKQRKRFEWLHKITKSISSSNSFINWGMEWDRFFKVNKTFVCSKYIA